MIDELLSAISPRKPGLSLDEAAELLKTDKKALEAFEMAYQDNILSQDPDPETEQLNAKQASEFKKQMDAGKMDGKYAEAIESLINRVVDELVPQTKYLRWRYRQAYTACQPRLNGLSGSSSRTKRMRQ